MVREAEIERSLAGDDMVRSCFVSCPRSHLPLFCYHQSYDKVLLHMSFVYVRAGKSRAWSNVAVMLINHAFSDDTAGR